MKCIGKEYRGIPYAVAEQGILQKPQDAIDLIASCWEIGTVKLLLPAESLDESFFRLRTGLAGEVLQKFTNYGITAAVLADMDFMRGKFQDFMAETNRGNQFRIFQWYDEAVEWLTGE